MASRASSVSMLRNTLVSAHEDLSQRSTTKADENATGRTHYAPSDSDHSAGYKHVKAKVEKEIRLKSSQGSSSHSDNHTDILQMELGNQLPFLFLAFLLHD